MQRLLIPFARPFFKTPAQGAATPIFGSAAATLRWMLIHMVETVKHVGHLDAIRELLDGEKGYY